MADTRPAPNNKSITFGTKTEREAMAWNNQGKAESNGTLGKNPAGVENTAPMPKSKPTKMPKKARRAMKRGMISEKAAKKHFGGV